jgi:hypothetical protein
MSEWQPIETAPKDGTKVCYAKYSKAEERWLFLEDYYRQVSADTLQVADLATYWTHLPPAPATQPETKGE